MRIKSLTVSNCKSYRDRETDGFRRLEDTIELLEPAKALEWLQAEQDKPEMAELELICLEILGVAESDRETVRNRARGLLRNGQKGSQEATRT